MTEDLQQTPNVEQPEDEPTLKRRMKKSDIFKFVGLIAFFVLLVLICVLAWPYISQAFEQGDLDGVVAQMRDAGIVGMLMLLGMQFLQIVVAFIPGEVVQLAAGMVYGPWLGALIILVGCVISSAFIFVLVHRLGAPFVQDLVPVTYLERFKNFEKSGKLSIVVFILFLIPGLPKDTFTYLVPLTDMRMRVFLALTTIGRIPGVVMSTLATSNLASGNFVVAIVLFVVVGAIAIIAILFRDRVMDFFSRFRKGSGDEKDQNKGDEV